MLSPTLSANIKCNHDSSANFILRGHNREDIEDHAQYMTQAQSTKTNRVPLGLTEIENMPFSYVNLPEADTRN